MHQIKHIHTHKQNIGLQMIVWQRIITLLLEWSEWVFCECFGVISQNSPSVTHMSVVLTVLFTSSGLMIRIYSYFIYLLKRGRSVINTGTQSPWCQPESYNIFFHCIAINWIQKSQWGYWSSFCLSELYLLSHSSTHLQCVFSFFLS